MKTINEIINDLNCELISLKGTNIDTTLDVYKLAKEICSKNNSVLENENATFFFSEEKNDVDKIYLKIKNYSPCLFLNIFVNINFYNESAPLNGGMIHNVNIELIDKLKNIINMPIETFLLQLEKKYINVELDKINSEIFDKEEELRDLKDERARLLKIKNS